jgi:F0F1-type ATP synthase membrane subunit a
VVEQTLWDLLSFLMLLSGLIVFSGLVVLIIVLIHKTRKIDLEIGRLQKVAEMHELGMIEGLLHKKRKKKLIFL